MSARPPLDHLVYTVPSLAEGSEAVAHALGLELTEGGAHPGVGTANTLASLGPGVYLEVLGPDPATPRERWGELGIELARDEWPDIVTFAAASEDLEAAASRAAGLGLRSAILETSSRRTPDRRLLRWRGMYVFSADYLGLVPFMIDWGDTPHPSATAVQGATLASVFVTHPRPQPLREIYEALGVSIPVIEGSRPAMVAHLRHGAREFVLTGSGRGLPAQRRGAAALLGRLQQDVRSV
ncbi:MAG: VOC family protein [Steroidobacteraceae bacterium]|jgi:hypothetical protein|nr:VOC family protein [Steroidobacteraceae bacterium]